MPIPVSLTQKTTSIRATILTGPKLCGEIGAFIKRLGLGEAQMSWGANDHFILRTPEAQKAAELKDLKYRLIEILSSDDSTKLRGKKITFVTPDGLKVEAEISQIRSTKLCGKYIHYHPTDADNCNDMDIEDIFALAELEIDLSNITD